MKLVAAVVEAAEEKSGIWLGRGVGRQWRDVADVRPSKSAELRMHSARSLAYVVGS